MTHGSCQAWYLIFPHSHHVAICTQSGITVSDAEPQIVKETPAVALVDGMNCLGPVVGNYCMTKAIEKAKTVGVGVVAARNSNHYGIAGWYGQMALEQLLTVNPLYLNSCPCSVS